MPSCDEDLSKHWVVSQQRTRTMFLSNAGSVHVEDDSLRKKKLALKTNLEYKAVKNLQPLPQMKTSGQKRKADVLESSNSSDPLLEEETLALEKAEAPKSSTALAVYSAENLANPFSNPTSKTRIDPNTLAVAKRQYSGSMPVWHAPWKLMRVISGHTGLIFFCLSKNSKTHLLYSRLGAISGSRCVK